MEPVHGFLKPLVGGKTACDMQRHPEKQIPIVKAVTAVARKINVFYRVRCGSTTIGILIPCSRNNGLVRVIVRFKIKTGSLQLRFTLHQPRYTIPIQDVTE